jgi:HSP20 family protein
MTLTLTDSFLSMNSCCDSSSTGAAAVRVPEYSVSADEVAYTLRVDLPGVPKAGVNVEVERGLLTVRAGGRPGLPEGWRGLRSELPVGDYELRLRMRQAVDAAGISAGLEDGVLTVVLPLRAEEQGRRIELN